MSSVRQRTRNFLLTCHYVAIGRVCYEDEFPPRIRLEELFKQEFADSKGSADIAEIQWTRIEGAARVSLIDEIHVIPRYLLRCSGQIVKVSLWD